LQEKDGDTIGKESRKNDWQGKKAAPAGSGVSMALAVAVGRAIPREFSLWEQLKRSKVTLAVVVESAVSRELNP
jgi:hypothetical protein